MVLCNLLLFLFNVTTKAGCQVIFSI